MTYFDTGIGTERLVLLVVALTIAFGFEFVNGFHDTANAVATVIYTRTLRPWYAVILSGMCNFAGVYLGGIAVAMSIIKLLPVELLASSGSGAGLAMVLALLVAAIAWNLGTWYFGLPASSSHTLIGAIVGVGLANSMMPGHVFGTGVNWGKVKDIGLSLVVSPLFGLTLAALLLLLARKVLTQRVFHEPADPTAKPPLWVRILLVGTCSGVSFAHGSNDGQKGVGLVMLILIGILPADFALNTKYQAADIVQAVAVVDQASSTTRLAYADSDPNKLAANGPTEVPESLARSVLEDLSSIRASLAGKKTLHDVPVAERWDLRTKVMRVDVNLAALDKSQPKALSKEQAVAMKAARSSLRGLVDYAPSWVLVFIALALGIGTMIGWKRIVVTVGEKIGKTHMSYAQGASAELVAASTIGVSAYLGLPVSTTHVLSSGIAGTMIAQKSGLQRSTIRNIALAWVLTLPAAMLLAGGLFVAFREMIPDAPSAVTAKIDTSITAHDPEATRMPELVHAGVLRLHGSNTVGATLAPELVEAFFASKGGRAIQRSSGVSDRHGWTITADLGGPTAAVVEIETAGTATAFADLASKACDIGLASRRASTEEGARIAAAGLGDLFSDASEHVLGLDGIAVLVNRQNPTDHFTLAELARFYSGEQPGWTGDAAALGGAVLFARDEKSGTFDTFEAAVLRGKPMAPARRFSDNGRLAEELARTPAAIGFVSMSAAGDAKVAAVGDDAGAPAVPSAFNVATESYALQRRIYLYTTSATTHPLANALVAFALSAEGQRVVSRAGFVDLAIKRRAPAPCGAGCPAKYAALTEGADRLSLDFRFRSGGSDLDPRGHEDLARLATFMKANPTSRLALFGFADDVGRADVNIEVSRERARAVDTQLRERGVPAGAIEAFGEALPVASNATPAGREHNRRVEAWLLKN